MYNNHTTISSRPFDASYRHSESFRGARGITDSILVDAHSGQGNHLMACLIPSSIFRQFVMLL